MNTENAILSQLNPSQQEAVQQIDGPVMVIAGAGSGKTRALTYRIAYMLSKGISPFQILALTFTNKAAAEMKDRIINIVGDANAKAVAMGTFHSIFYRILRQEGDRLGFTHNLTVYDTDDSKSLIHSIVKEMSLDPKVYKEKFVLGRISSAKSNLISAEEYANNPEIIAIDSKNHRPHIAEIFGRYNKRLKDADAMDFDDLLYFMNVLLRDFPDVLLKYQNRYRYILVDEYQDTNFAQYLIIKKLAARHHNICVVGDDAQSIYSFRGADIQNILNFKRDYPEAKIVKLEQNYRSTQNIVKAANAVIKNNEEQLDKEVWTANAEGKKIDIVLSATDNDEATFIANSIFETKQNDHVPNAQFAILYRTNAQSRALEEALIKRHIPYKIYAGMSFYKRREIKNVLAYFRLAINNYDEESLRRIINYPQRGIGETTLNKLIVAAQEQQVRLWHVVENPDMFLPGAGSAVRAKIRDFATLIKSFTAMIQTTNAYDLGDHIIRVTGIFKDLNDDILEKERWENVAELLDSLKSFTDKTPDDNFNPDTGELIEKYFPTLDRYMESVALLTDEEEDKSGEDSDKVKLMTIHAAKGLEFGYVYVSGLEESLFPSSMCLTSREDIEEERRLFYVAITRAQKVLTLTHCQMRYRFGSLQFCEPSRFLDEIPRTYIKTIEKASTGYGMFAAKKSYGNSSYGRTPSSVTSRQSTSYSSPKPMTTSAAAPKTPIAKTSESINLATLGTPATADDIMPDVRVYHAKFGYGSVMSISGAAADKKAIIKFDSVGEKTLLLKFAKLIIPNI